MESITNGFNEIINSETLYISELWLFKSSINEYNIFWENIKIAIESCASGFGNIVINAANN